MSIKKNIGLYFVCYFLLLTFCIMVINMGAYYVGSPYFIALSSANEHGNRNYSGFPRAGGFMGHLDMDIDTRSFTAYQYQSLMLKKNMEHPEGSGSSAWSNTGLFKRSLKTDPGLTAFDHISEIAVMIVENIHQKDGKK